jgi:hypothetical protein
MITTPSKQGTSHVQQAGETDGNRHACKRYAWNQKET